MGIDLNPFKGSLFTGAGLPWGAMETGDPGAMPGIPQERDVNSFNAYDQSELVRRLISGLRSSGAKQQMGAMRTASRMGAGQSDAARLGLNEIAADVADRSAGVELQAAKDTWADKMAQKQFAEQMDMQRYKDAIGQWQAKKGMYESEKEKRAGALNPVSWVKGISSAIQGK